MAISTIGTYLGWVTAGSSKVYSKLCDIQDYSDLSGEPNTIETTTLSNSFEQTVPGVQTGGTVTFTAPLSGKVISQIDYWKTLVDSSPLRVCLMFSNGTCFLCEGRFSYYVEGKGVNDEVTMKIILYKSKDWVLQGSGTGSAWQMKKATYDEKTGKITTA